MHVQALGISDIMMITPRVYRDERGFFSETYSSNAFAAAGIMDTFVQDNHSLSIHSGVVRGLHFQIAPKSQGKLVRVPRGAILDVVVDVRSGSPTYGQHVSAVLSAENWAQLWVPAGFAHGYCTLEPNTEVVYKVTNGYAPDCDRGILWSDPALGIDWPVPCCKAILSEKDSRHPPLSELPEYFRYKG